jgi:DNA-binding NtrC family response regulator
MTQKIKVLIIEKDLDVLAFFEAAAEKINVIPVTTSTGGQGIRIAASDRFSVAFVGTELEDMDSMQVLKHIIKTHKKLNCFIMTFLASDPLLSKAMAAGAKGVIFKPPDLDQVATSIQRMEVIAFFEGQIRLAMERSSGTESPEVKGLKKALEEAKEATGTDVKLD